MRLGECCSCKFPPAGKVLGWGITHSDTSLRSVRRQQAELRCCRVLSRARRAAAGAWAQLEEVWARARASGLCSPGGWQKIPVGRESGQVRILCKGSPQRAWLSGMCVRFQGVLVLKRPCFFCSSGKQAAGQFNCNLGGQSVWRAKMVCPTVTWRGRQVSR